MTYARNHALGRFGEQVAGLEVLDRNWTCRHGEIDLVAREGSVLVVCEVKTRTSTRYGTPFEAVTAAKATRLRRLASAWLDAHDLQPPGVRIDVVSVVVPRRGPAEVVRIQGVA